MLGIVLNVLEDIKIDQIWILLLQFRIGRKFMFIKTYILR